MKVISLRYFYFFLGIIINSFGIAFITKSNLGTSQISSIPYIFSLEYTDFSFGLTTFIFNIIFILIEIALLRRDFEPIQFLQIVANIIFSFFIDVSMNLLSAFEPETLIVKLISLFIGCTILAIGICIEVAPNVIVVPGEGVVRALALAIAIKKPKVKFGTIKIYFDVTLIIIACILSFIFFGELNGIGLGTIVSALIVGRFINLVNRHFKFLRHIRALARLK
ncbi:YczE/YyaS/YitT family protein [Megamonas funiformis]|uniref:YczE/YyaS/YitT family protein n=1 Tax=Megamonas funiformis TaxID=437897 RepID=UPI00195F02A9|nr:DUF6198 family protein [Megamonas funiformis]MBM6726648.1 YitT family protein [Megamonas funiformis]